MRIEELVCDGVLVATPAGSTAYNLSANGPILPLDSNLLALTPISPFRPRRWHGAILPDRSRIQLRVLEPGKRPVSVVADQKELRDVAEVTLEIARESELTLLFDPGHALDERIVAEQFISLFGRKRNPRRSGLPNANPAHIGAPLPEGAAPR